MEVPEIYDGTVVIKGAVRQPGERAKVAVRSRERDVDPVGACVGMRGSRVQSIMRELHGEKIDVILYSDDLITFAQNALAPAKLKAFQVDEVSKRVKITVSEDQLSLAIGKRGQNARLTSKLTGWQVDIEPEVVVTKGFEEKVAEAVDMLAAIPGISREQADVLVHNGLLRLEDLLQADVSDLSGIDKIGEQAAAILEAARAEAQRRMLKVGEAPVSG
jgi:N utilization substance protein A